MLWYSMNHGKLSDSLTGLKDNLKLIMWEMVGGWDTVLFEDAQYNDMIVHRDNRDKQWII